LRSDLERLENQFQLILSRYEEAKTHNEKVELALIAKEIAKEYRKQIAEYKQRLQLKRAAAQQS
jgi:hypothetical protein